jgi:hypothetical protein
MPFQPRDTVAKGRGKASRSGKGILDPRLSEVMREFQSFESEDAKAAFAHRWVTLAADRLNETWPVFYQLLALIKKRELYRNPDWIFAPGEKNRRAYSSFEEYFEERLRQPFARWAELEATYHFVTALCPELLEVPLEDANRARVVAQAKELEGDPLSPNGGDRRSERVSVLQCKTETQEEWGNSSDYLTRRLARDRPDLIDRMKAGEFRSVRAAALEAGIVKPSVSFPRDVHAAARALARHFTGDELKTIVELLVDMERRAA